MRRSLATAIRAGVTPLLFAIYVPPVAFAPTARLVEKGSARLTASFAAVDARDDGAGAAAAGRVAEEYAAQVGVRASDEVEFLLSYSRVEPVAHAVGASHADAIAFGPRFAIVPERVALVTAVGAEIDGNLALRQFRIIPGLVVSGTVAPCVHPSLGARALVGLDDGASRFAIAECAVRVGPRSRRWAVIPAAAYAWRLGAGAQDRFASVGAGLEITR